MAKIRIHELAKELNIPSKELVQIIKELGIDVKNHMSTMEEEQGEWVKRKLREKEERAKKVEEPKTKPRETVSEARKKTEARKTPAEVKPSATPRKPELQPRKIKPAKTKTEEKTTEIPTEDLPRQDKRAREMPFEDQPSTRQKTDFRVKTFGGPKAGKPGRSKPKKKSRKHEQKQEETPEMITVEDRITVRELASKLAKSPAEVIKKLMQLNINASLNNSIDFDVAELVALEFNVRVEKEKSPEELILEEVRDDESKMKPRPPVVTVMGHVDHGKTSLLDAIRETNVVSREAGGITQHIGAYQVNIHNERITFIDTPGHEAFTAMRARGAQATDIAVLVVAADDGVMPQTVEAINHARAARVPILVAINKIDKESANPELIKQQLTKHQLIPEEWGGDTIFVPVSAKTGEGIDLLLEMIILIAEMRELKADPDRPAEGVVIEGQLDRGRGPVATILVQKGTLRVGDTLLCGTAFGKVRAMVNDRGNRITEAGPSTPVEVLGLTDVPMAGDIFRAVDEKVARQVSALRLSEKKREEQTRTSKVSLDDFFKQIQEGEVKELNLIIKGDVQGSVEAIIQSLERLSTDEVKVNVIHTGVGAVNESDVMLASASNAIIIGFNVRPDSKARKYAEEEHIEIRLYRVIYETIEDIKKAMAGLLEPEHVERFQGRSEVRATFKVPKAGVVAGCYVMEGKVTRNANIRVLRDGMVIYEGKLSSLKRFKDDVKEVQTNFECGVGIEGFNDIKEGDILETYTIEDVPREL
ncbi:MAG: translation initiation factor IF-2 [Syntrophomonadaceae bacterium]|jgi:translation initiation factor IF-2|nr:translation initiation factor IF-2 [Syntrophomonadaceae bacterium]